MKLSEIQKFRIDVVSKDENVLYILMDRDGMISRQGTGYLPVEEFTVTSESDGKVFSQMIELLDEQVFDHVGVYDHPDKQGVPVVVSVAFLDSSNENTFFEFRFGTENQDVGELLPYFDAFIAQAVRLTDHWYQQELDGHRKADTPA